MSAVAVPLLKFWVVFFIPLGLVGLAMVGLWKLVPRLRKSMGYRSNDPRSR